MFNPSDHPLCLASPRRIVTSAWIEHAPFALFCVEASKPRILVELGTEQGFSYGVFCQAVQELGLPTRCYAVDTWEGDAHTGAYGAETLEKLRAYHDPLYGEFSTLMQTTFDEAANWCGDGKVDLLHIDGLHTYEAVKHDFETWLPKMSERGVILLHDTEERYSNFGVWKFWKEVASRWPSFNFLHEHGLGVLLVGAEAPPLLREVAAYTPEQLDTFRILFEDIGSSIHCLI